MEDKPDVREAALKNGLSYPSDEELVMLILGKGTEKMPVRALSRKVISVINRTGSENCVRALMKIDGIGETKALAIAASLELGRRRMGFMGVKIMSPASLVPFVKYITIEPTEHFLCVSLNGANEVLKIRVISSGGLNRALLSARDVFSGAIAERASAVIFCHNHPSGSVKPSDEDIETTELLLCAARLLGITVLDHIILSRESYFSFMEHGILFQKRKSLAKSKDV